MKGKKKKKKQPDLPVKSDLSQVSRFPVFSERFREDLGWWYKTDKQKAYKILRLLYIRLTKPQKTPLVANIVKAYIAAGIAAADIFSNVVAMVTAKAQFWIPTSTAIDLLLGWSS